MNHLFGLDTLYRILAIAVSAYAGYGAALLSTGTFDRNKFHPGEMLKISSLVATACTKFGTALIVETVLCCLIFILKDLPMYWCGLVALFFASHLYAFTGIWSSGSAFWALNRMFVFVAPFFGAALLWFMQAEHRY